MEYLQCEKNHELGDLSEKRFSARQNSFRKRAETSVSYEPAEKRTFLERLGRRH